MLDMASETENKLNETEKKALIAEGMRATKVTFFRNQYKSLNPSDQSGVVDLINNPDAILKMIEKRNVEKKEEEDDEDEKKKKAEADKAKEDEDPEPKTNSIKINASGQPTLRAPSGQLIEGDVGKISVLNQGLPGMHIIDPLKAPKTAPKIKDMCRINTLPPDAEHPYERLIA